jgi:sigma-E factor negative regulatory protein RseC
LLIETGRVVGVEHDFLWVETVKASVCGSCAARAGCGQRLLAGCGRRGVLRVVSGPQLSAADCRVGDEVSFGLAESAVLRASFVVYSLPLCGTLGGALLSRALLPASGDGATLLGALAGLLLGLAGVRWHGWRHMGDPALQPVLQERVVGRRRPDSAPLAIGTE